VSHELIFRYGKTLSYFPMFLLRAQQNHKSHEMNKLFLPQRVSIHHLSCSRGHQKLQCQKLCPQNTSSSPEAEFTCRFLKLHFILAVLNTAKFLQY